ncbi:MAG: hypothetical protein J2P36_22615, partial [Ktedonobacteraceae bacterium]|nr:hypothetical protein [Ktedonobacteraceae bacterium]
SVYHMGFPGNRQKQLRKWLYPIAKYALSHGSVPVHWSIHAEMSHFVRLCMDYEDSNWFKPDGIWFKVAKRRFVVEQEHATE